MSPRKFLTIAIVAAVAALAVPAPAQASHSWNGYHWARTSNPFTLKLGDNVDTKWDSYLGTTSADWSKSTVLDTAVVTGSSKPRQCRPPSGRVEVCNATYGSTGWLGIASISITGGTHITSGSVKVNDTYFNTAKYNTPAWRNLVMCQEVGHTLGLDHQDEDFTNPNLDTCMDYTNFPESNQHPNAHDYDMLATIYSHLDSFSTVGRSGWSGVDAGYGTSRSTWGTLVSGSVRSGQSTYMRDYGHGRLVITHVTWA